VSSYWTVAEAHRTLIVICRAPLKMEWGNGLSRDFWLFSIS